MPKYTHDETEFRISIAKSGEQYRATVPKLLMERLGDAVAISGRFTIRNGELVLTEKTRTITLTKLLSQWWPFPASVTRDQVDEMDWDQLLEVLGLEVDDYQGKHVTVGDFDTKSYDTLHVVFNTE